MPIKKQEFYEGAALHQIACACLAAQIRYEPPFFRLNDHTLVLIKYSTKKRSPWGFTFTQSEQALLRVKAEQSTIVLGLICGADGIAALRYDAYVTIAGHNTSAFHISCYRSHGQHYEIKGPDGALEGKVPPSRWKGILLREELS
jgi:hypothetical protein